MTAVNSEQLTVNGCRSRKGQKLLGSRICKAVLSLALSCMMLFLPYFPAGASSSVQDEHGSESEGFSAEPEQGYGEGSQSSEPTQTDGAHEPDETDAQDLQVTNEGDLQVADEAEPLSAMPLTATASSLDAIDHWDDLASWLEAHKETGGTVALTADIEVADFSYFNFMHDIIIDTGEYGITVTGSMTTGLWYNAGPLLEIRGEGVNRPVLSFTGSYLAPNDAVFTAYGNESGGGVAVYLNNDWSNYAVTGALFVRSYGIGAVGVSCGGSMTGTGLRVESDGVAIDAAGGVDLFASHISGSVNAGGRIILDTCLVSQEAPGATVINRKIKALTGGAYFVAGKPYAYQVSGRPADYGMIVEGGRLDAQTAFTAILSAEGVSDRTAAVFVKYGRAPIDTETIGAMTVLRAELLYPFAGLTILQDDSYMDMTVETVDGNIPQYMSAFAGWSGYTFRYLYTGESLAPLTLWRADWCSEWDSGGSLAGISPHWMEIWRENDPELAGASVTYLDFLNELSVTISRSNITAPVLLAFEAAGLGGSKVLYYDPDGGEPDPDFGGDRDGGDRFLLPWELLFGDQGGNGDNGGKGGSGNDDDSGNGGSNGIESGADDNAPPGTDRPPPSGGGGNGSRTPGSGYPEYSGDNSGNSGGGTEGISEPVPHGEHPSNSGTETNESGADNEEVVGSGQSSQPADLPVGQSGAEANTNQSAPDSPGSNENSMGSGSAEISSESPIADAGSNLILEPIDQTALHEVFPQGGVPLSEIPPQKNPGTEIPEVSARSPISATFDIAPPMNADDNSPLPFTFIPVAASAVAIGVGASWLIYILRKKGVFLRR